MCWQCANRHATRADYQGMLMGQVKRLGWALHLVGDERAADPFGHTVGLSAYGEPELAVWGLPPTSAADLLNGLAAHVIHAEAPEPGEQMTLTNGGPLVEFVEISQPSVHLPDSEAMFGPGIRALQVVRADDRGHWPWEPGYRRGRRRQPVLGIRGPLAAGPPGRSQQSI